MAGDAPPLFTDRSFAFFEQLGRNNSHEWFAANGAEFREAVDEPFLALLADLSSRLSRTAVPLRGSAASCYPMARDRRFTRDRTPYVLSRSALMTRTGRLTEAGAAIYLQISVGGGTTFCGFHAMDATTLAPMHRRILRHPERFDDALEVMGDAGYTLTREDAPRRRLGSEPSGGGRHADILGLRTLGVRQELPRDDWTSGAVAQRVERLARATMPMIAFFD